MHDSMGTAVDGGSDEVDRRDEGGAGWKGGELGGELRGNQGGGEQGGELRGNQGGGEQGGELGGQQEGELDGDQGGEQGGEQGGTRRARSRSVLPTTMLSSLQFVRVMMVVLS